MDLVLHIAAWLLGCLAAVLVIWNALGLVRIDETEVGIVVKKFGSKNLRADRLIALEGESGYQADTLAPGIHLWLWPWKFQVKKVPMVEIPSGEIGLVMAADGAAIQTNRILAKSVDCDNFQDARKFLQNGGEKGRQVAILTAGRYRINLAMFTVITSRNADKHGLKSELLQVYKVQSDKVGIVTTLDGAPVDHGEIAGPIVQGHNNFQDPETFMKNGGRRGLQEQVLLSGTWNLNPWFASVEQVDMTPVPIGHVGVVISYVGKSSRDLSGDAFKHGDLVANGDKGVWVTPLSPGKHPLNTRIMKVELVPTTNIVLNWATRTESHKFDEKLSSITVRSKDGFSFNLDVSQIIHVGAKEAPKVISRVGNMRNLVDQVLEPIIGNYFRNSTQNHTVLDFLVDRKERQAEAAQHIRAALSQYDVEAIDTLIGDIVPPADLMKTQTDRKIAQEQQETYKAEEAAQKQRQELERQKAIANSQVDVVKSEQEVRIAEQQAQARVKAANGEAEATKLRAAADAEATKLRAAAEAEQVAKVGAAKAEAYLAGVKAMGEYGYVAVQVMNVIGEKNVKVTPDTLIQSGDNGGGLLSSFLATLLKKELKVSTTPPAPVAPIGGESA